MILPQYFKRYAWIHDQMLLKHCQLHGRINYTGGDKRIKNIKHGILQGTGCLCAPKTYIAGARFNCKTAVFAEICLQ